MANYGIREIIGMSNIWRFTLKMQLAKFYLAVLNTVWIETHAYNLNGVHLIWQYSRNSPNRQIKATAKYTVYSTLIDTNSIILFRCSVANYFN